MFDIQNYKNTFPKFPPVLQIVDGKLYGWFFIGNDFKNKDNYYGQFPPSFLERIYAIFPNRENILHVYSGMVKDDRVTTVDINPELKPTVCDDVINVSKHFDLDTFDLIIADPPYSKEDADKYNVPYTNKRLVLRELRKVATEDCILVWLDIRPPIWRNEEWKLKGMVGIGDEWEPMGSIGVFAGSNRLLRAALIFKANEEY